MEPTTYSTSIFFGSRSFSWVLLLATRSCIQLIDRTCVGAHGSKYASLFPIWSLLRRIPFHSTPFDWTSPFREWKSWTRCLFLRRTYILYQLFNDSTYFISTLQRQYDIWSSDDQSYKCSCFSAFFFPDVVCITPNPSSADKFYPLPFNLDCTSTSIPGKVMNERKLIPFDLAFCICGNFRHVLGFRYFLIWRGFSCGISSPCGIFCWTIFGGYLCRCAFES